MVNHKVPGCRLRRIGLDIPGVIEPTEADTRNISELIGEQIPRENERNVQMGMRAICLAENDEKDAQSFKERQKEIQRLIDDQTKLELKKIIKKRASRCATHPRATHSHIQGYFRRSLPATRSSSQSNTTSPAWHPAIDASDLARGRFQTQPHTRATSTRASAFNQSTSVLRDVDWRLARYRSSSSTSRA